MACQFVDACSCIYSNWVQLTFVYTVGALYVQEKWNSLILRMFVRVIQMRQNVVAEWSCKT